MNRGCASASATSPDGQSEFLRRLVEIRQDPQVRGLARREAGALDLAEDTMQEALYAVAKVKNPGGIENLGAYFWEWFVEEWCTVATAHQRPGWLSFWESGAAPSLIKRPLPDTSFMSQPGVP